MCAVKFFKENKLDLIYSIIKFKTINKQNASIELVPSSWLEEAEDGNYCCVFPLKKDWGSLEKWVKDCIKPADIKWRNYKNIEILSRAQNYAQAEQRLKRAFNQAIIESESDGGLVHCDTVDSENDLNRILSTKASLSNITDPIPNKNSKATNSMNLKKCSIVSDAILDKPLLERKFTSRKRPNRTNYDEVNNSSDESIEADADNKGLQSNTNLKKNTDEDESDENNDDDNNSNISINSVTNTVEIGSSVTIEASSRTTNNGSNRTSGKAKENLIDKLKKIRNQEPDVSLFFDYIDAWMEYNLLVMTNYKRSIQYDIQKTKKYAVKVITQNQDGGNDSVVFLNPRNDLEYDLPIDKLNTFSSFNQDLSKDKKKQQALTPLFGIWSAGSKDYEDAITTIITEIIKPKVQIKYAAIGRVTKNNVPKLDFSATKSYQLLKEFVAAKYSKEQGKIKIISIISRFPSGASDRDHGRKKK